MYPLALFGIFNLCQNQRWRNELLFQLQNLQIKEWPDILAQFIKKSKNSSSSDIRFQAEMFWLDHNYTSTKRL